MEEWQGILSVKGLDGDGPGHGGVWFVVDMLAETKDARNSLIENHHLIS